MLRNPMYGRSGSAFPELTKVTPARWADLTAGVIATTWRSADRESHSFRDHVFGLLTDLTMFVMRWQITMWFAEGEENERPQWDDGRPQRSAILSLRKFAYHVLSGRIYVDPRLNKDCNPAVFDCALPRSLWGEKFPHYLDPMRNNTAADLAFAMGREANRALDAGEPISYQPTLPVVYLMFTRPPLFERSMVLEREASAELDKPVDDITDDELREYFWSQSFEDAGCTFVPQRYMAHQGDYLKHPVNGSDRPSGAGTPMKWGGKNGSWYFDNGRWNPAAQRPYSVWAHVGPILGRPYRNPAFSVLKACKYLAADLNYKDFISDAKGLVALEKKVNAALDSNVTAIGVLTHEMRKALYRVADMASEDDIKDALLNPEKPMNLSFAAGVQLVRYSGQPPESMTWEFPGGHCDLHSVRDIWAPRVASAEGWLTGSPDHGRASAPFVH